MDPRGCAAPINLLATRAEGTIRIWTDNACGRGKTARGREPTRLRETKPQAPESDSSDRLFGAKTNYETQEMMFVVPVRFLNRR